jgi:energy-coupling factor transport system permease protein
MALSVPLGHYIPGNSSLHGMDPRIKLTLLAAFALALFCTSGWFGLFFCVILLAIGLRISKTPSLLVFKGIKPLLVLLALTFVFNAFTFTATPDAPWVLLSGNTLSNGSVNGSLTWLLGNVQVPESFPLIGSFGIRTLGAINGLYFVVRIALLIGATSLLTFTTSTLELTDSLASILGPLRHVHVPVDDVATLFSITLRFIPLTAEEVDRLVLAQRARGAVFDTGSPLARMRAWTPVLIPLFVSLFRRADQLADAMDARCYGATRRTRLRVMTTKPSDILVGVGVIMFCLIIAFLL